jgi:hypothetical protein
VAKSSTANSTGGAAPQCRKPPLRAVGRSIEDFKPLLSAEEKLLACCRKGELATIGEKPPEEETDDNCVRAEFIRFLVLGGDEAAPVHEHGVELTGAWVKGKLDLEGADTSGSMWLYKCRLENINLQQAHISAVGLDGSRLDGELNGDSVRCEARLFLRNGFHALGRVRLNGARIGILDCDNASFVGGEEALNCSGAVVSGGLFLRDSRFRGCVSLFSTEIGTDLDCSRSEFLNPGGIAFVCSRATVGGGFFWRNVKAVQGTVDLSSSAVGTLLDDRSSWECTRGATFLDGFKYNRLVRTPPVNAQAHVHWLLGQRKKDLAHEFRPQPWEQLTTVLREMGYPDEARTVALEKHKAMRGAGRYVGGSWIWDRIYGGLVGYGYRPWRLLWIVGAVWLGCALAYSAAIRPHLVGAPTPLLAQARPEIDLPCLVQRVSSGSTTPCPRAAPDFKNFVSLAYSAEVLLPVINLGSKAEWRPVLATSDGEPIFWGWMLFGVYWFETAFGWLAGLLLVAAFGNLVKKE